MINQEWQSGVVKRVILAVTWAESADRMLG